VQEPNQPEAGSDEQRVAPNPERGEATVQPRRVARTHSDPAAGKNADADRRPNIPDVPFDETDAAWGEYPQDSDDWLRQQRPPHHGG
jgi:hypothetical protein